MEEPKKEKPRRFVKMFKPRFAELIRSGAKRQTIRPTPKRLPKAGDIIDCREWTGKPYRSPQLHIVDGYIFSVMCISITAEGVVTETFESFTQMMKPLGMRDELAKADGFESFDEMRDWFQREHGLPFGGILIKWRDL